MKKGFTLAEVLITLGIIGIVAALTLPGLINKSKQQVRNQQFKKVYATLSNALRLMQADSEALPNCYYRNNEYDHSYFLECDQFFDEFTAKLHVIKTCKGNALANGCIPKYNDVTPSYGCLGFSQANIFNNSHVFVLKDGAIIMTYWYNSSPASIFAVDINGKKSPNMWGHDIFSFRVTEDPGIRLEPDGCNLIEKGGLGAKDMIQNIIYK